MASFAERNKGEVPLEIELNNVVDTEFDRVFARTEFAQVCRENYAATVLSAESVSLEKEAMELERKAQAIRDEIALREAEMPSLNPIKSRSRQATPSLPDLPSL